MHIRCTYRECGACDVSGNEPSQKKGGEAVRSREEKELEERAGAFAGNAASRNAQMGTDTAIDSMQELLYKAGKISKVGFDQSKGNLFEYIEAAKLQKNMANRGEYFDRNPVTDLAADRGGYGGHTAPDDFRMQKNGRIVGRGQAKYNNSPRRAAQNFVNPKYTDMQRIAPTDQMTDIESCLQEMLANGEISKAAYKNAVSNLMKNGLTDPSSGITSGGTTTTELQKLRGANGKVSQQAVRQYAARFEGRQLAHEVGTTASNMAVASGVITAIVSGTQNLFAVLQDRKTLDSALAEVKADTVSSALRGGETGVLSTVLRFGGQKAALPVLSDSTAATVMAGGMIDGGAALYSYTRGEISGQQLQGALMDTTVKSVATVYFTKAIGLVAGAANPFVPMAVYTAAAYVVSCTRAIVEQAELNAAEYDRITALLKESLRLEQEYHRRLVDFMDQYEQQQKIQLNGLLDAFAYLADDDTNYERAVYAILKYADQTGLALQHKDFSTFRTAMRSEEDFVLR